MATPEARIKADILAALGQLPELMVWNNPTGVGLGLNSDRKLTFGCKGSADILGVLAVEIRPEHVGLTIGRALGIEVKTPVGQQSDQQKKWQAAWEKRGGLYILARSPEEALRGIGR